MKKLNSQFNFSYFDKLDEKKKTDIVKNIFNSVHNKYDIMNDIMSAGLHRIWKRELVSFMSLSRNMKVLDLASGTCDLSNHIVREIKMAKNLFMVDINYKMLKNGKKKCLDNNILYPNILKCNVENMPFKNDYFDRISISFGFRNIMRKEKALKEIHRCLKLGGKFIILEFSEPSGIFFKKIYEVYLSSFIPAMGSLISKNFYSYEYLSKSIKKHPNQEKLKIMMEESGFTNVSYKNLSNGIAAIHYGYKCY